MAAAVPFGRWPSPLTAASVAGAAPLPVGADRRGHRALLAGEPAGRGRSPGPGALGGRGAGGRGVAPRRQSAFGGARVRWRGLLPGARRRPVRRRRARRPAGAALPGRGRRAARGAERRRGPRGTRWPTGTCGPPPTAAGCSPCESAWATAASAATVVACSVERPGRTRSVCLGRDFFAAPRPDPAGRRLAWICWDHPDMPWDASELWVGDLDLDADREAVSRGAPDRRRTVRSRGGGGVGRPAPVVCRRQPGLRLRRGRLVAAVALDGRGRGRPAGRRPAEYHGPDWALGQATMAELDDGSIVCRRRRPGATRSSSSARTGPLGDARPAVRAA